MWFAVGVQVNTTLQLTLVALTLVAPVLGYVDHMALQTLWSACPPLLHLSVSLRWFCVLSCAQEEGGGIMISGCPSVYLSVHKKKFSVSEF